MERLWSLAANSGYGSARGARKMWYSYRGGQSDSNDLEVHGGGQVIENVVMMLPFS